MRVVLRGYFGFGNFGDDLLMIRSYQLISTYFPKDQISILCLSNDFNYIQKLLPEIKICSWEEMEAAELIIHGGGGVFFDFKKGNIFFWILNQLIQFIGIKNFSMLYYFLKKRKRPAFRMGLGIGVGTYTKSSRRYYTDGLLVNSFDFLMVRDKQSVELSKKYFSLDHVHIGSDLVFTDEFQNKKQTYPSTNLTIGFILRDWPYDHHAHVKIQLAVARNMELQGYRVRFFSFDQADQFYHNSLPNTNLLIWDPNNMTISYFLNELQSCDVVVSSRAHGAIVSACLGVPAICLGIENKMKRVYEMLESSAQFVHDPTDEQETQDQIVYAIKNLDKLSVETTNDVERNRQVMRSALDEFKQFILEINEERK